MRSSVLRLGAPSREGKCPQSRRRPLALQQVRAREVERRACASARTSTDHLPLDQLEAGGLSLRRDSSAEIVAAALEFVNLGTQRGEAFLRLLFPFLESPNVTLDHPPVGPDDPLAALPPDVRAFAQIRANRKAMGLRVGELDPYGDGDRFP